MKKTLCALLVAAMGAIAAEAILEIPLQDGKFDAIAATGAVAEVVKVKANRVEKLTWKEGRLNDKGLYFVEKNRKSKALPYISIEKNGKIDLTKPFTISCWAMPDKQLIRTQQYTIIGDTCGDRGPGLRLFISYGCIRFVSGDGKELKSLCSTASKHPIELGVWSHFAVTYDGTKMCLYMNGSKVDEKEVAAILAGNKYISVGAYRDGTAYGFDGAIGDIKLYDAALSELEIMKIAKDL